MATHVLHFAKTQAKGSQALQGLLTSQREYLRAASANVTAVIADEIRAHLRKGDKVETLPSRHAQQNPIHGSSRSSRREDGGHDKRRVAMSNVKWSRKGVL